MARRLKIHDSYCQGTPKFPSLSLKDHLRKRRKVKNSVPQIFHNTLWIWLNITELTIYNCYLSFVKIIRNFRAPLRNYTAPLRNKPYHFQSKQWYLSQCKRNKHENAEKYKPNADKGITRKFSREGCVWQNKTCWRNNTEWKKRNSSDLLDSHSIAEP